MKHLLLALCAAAAFGLPSASAAQEEPIRAVIEAQIKAFEADDFDTAFTYASPTIQGMFGNARNFGTMVKSGYPMVWRPDNLRFLALEERNGRLYQDVMVRDLEGALHILEYQMQEGEKGWKINGVNIRRATEGTA
ncbi:protein of unknown function [Roseovarius nanhaiticus]|uniref:DUF4864 domain-containing protein n=1 Tax=Roseovarius nanhaiticus TaxID=573024 RepID=A0A1N7HEB3_9RHOB|nr:DUF4864 domain-containing protein [Roseovarius nanhaiticus]SEL00301.1 protein of unknown function [Roseovarius nanhaiticus]SIS23103.1 protein of unknown function [Roseovarius nanhaiticus]